MIELKTGIKFELITGKFITYSHLIADDGYCFYDKDLSENERIYCTEVKTPERNENLLKEKYISILGDAEKLNAEISEKTIEGNLGDE